MIFLTNGRRWLGPYSTQLPGDIARAQRWMREVEPDTVDVWMVSAGTIEKARRLFARGRKTKKM